MSTLSIRSSVSGNHYVYDSGICTRKPISALLTKFKIPCWYQAPSLRKQMVKTTQVTKSTGTTIELFSGSDGILDANGTCLRISGGNVTVNTGAIPGSHSNVPSIPQGFSTNYLMRQQGLTANISCWAIDSTASSNNSITGLHLWNISANCGIRPIDVNQTYTSFTIFTQGFYKYNSLKASTCKVVPLLTTVHANYSNEQISSEVILSAPFHPENTELLLFIAGVARTYEQHNWGYLIFHLFLDHYREDYWCGVVEFSATFLHSGFMAVGSVPNNDIPNNLSSQVNGTMFILTIGWTHWAKNSLTYLFATMLL
ncbi:uncharacterized protein EDB93DRAFT_1109325 [Suillus bovinus]|uniref:uncharacterized protein n=1 Tax=Suillus bovinus TaxID=48563 RepID=UPI001B85FA66|nr:uncharacterized protein EDB93DRAFT_1109325 [Suillus bovinus]KAG2127283.1 hypothetical protein EDB93DRAFT_1109325 [Suillus bovinus]